jgi:hypothetical protein
MRRNKGNSFRNGTNTTRIFVYEKLRNRNVGSSPWFDVVTRGKGIKLAGSERVLEKLPGVSTK